MLKRERRRKFEKIQPTVVVVVSQFNGTSTPKGSYSAKTGDNDCKVNSSRYSLSTALCESNSLSGQVWTKCPTRPDTQGRHVEAALMHPYGLTCTWKCLRRRKKLKSLKSQSFCTLWGKKPLKYIIPSPLSQINSDGSWWYKPPIKLRRGYPDTSVKFGPTSKRLIPCISRVSMHYW